MSDLDQDAVRPDKSYDWGKKELEEIKRTVASIMEPFEKNRTQRNQKLKKRRQILSVVAAVAGAALVWVGTWAPITFWNVLVGELGKALLVAFTINVGVALLYARTQGIGEDVPTETLRRVMQLQEEVSSVAHATPTRSERAKFATTVGTKLDIQRRDLGNIEKRIEDVMKQLSRVEKVTEEALAPAATRNLLKLSRQFNMHVAEVDRVLRAHEDPDTTTTAGTAGVTIRGRTMRRVLESVGTALTRFASVVGRGRAAVVRSMRPT